MTMKNSWQTKKLGEVGAIFSGNSINERVKKEKYSNLEEGLPFVATKDVDFETHFIDYNNGVRIPIGEKSFRVAHKNSVLICAEGGSSGKKIAFNNRDACFGNKLIAIETFESILPKFVYYWYLTPTFFEAFKYQMSGIIGGISIGNFKELTISFPPIVEQKRIVKILDEAFEKVAKAKENAEKNLKNSKELFESYLQSVFANPGREWEEKNLNEVCNVEYGYTEQAKNAGDFRFVRITDTDGYGMLTKDKKMYIDKFKESGKYLLNNGDLLMARTGASAGNVLLFESNEPSIFASYLIRLKFKKEILSKFYWYFSKSKLYWNQVDQLSVGSAQPQFNGGALRQIIFPFPKSLFEQKTIVKKLESLSQETRKLEKVYEKKLALLEELKKSVLRKVFAGEL
jgi:type I restriction enzyme S subunit